MQVVHMWTMKSGSTYYEKPQEFNSLKEAAEKAHDFVVKAGQPTEKYVFETYDGLWVSVGSEVESITSIPWEKFEKFVREVEEAEAAFDES